MNRKERVLKRMRHGHNCAEAVAGTFADVTGLDEETCIRAATGFGAGAARTGHICGLISGSILVLSLEIDRRGLDHETAKERVYSVVRRLITAVEASHGSILCPKILGADLSDPVDRQRILDHHLFEVQCHPVAEHITDLVESFLEEAAASE